MCSFLDKPVALTGPPRNIQTWGSSGVFHFGPQIPRSQVFCLPEFLVRQPCSTVLVLFFVWCTSFSVLKWNLRCSSFARVEGPPYVTTGPLRPYCPVSPLPYSTTNRHSIPITLVQCSNNELFSTIELVTWLCWSGSKVEGPCTPVVRFVSVSFVTYWMRNL